MDHKSNVPSHYEGGGSRGWGVGGGGGGVGRGGDGGVRTNGNTRNNTWGTMCPLKVYFLKICFLRSS